MKLVKMPNFSSRAHVVLGLRQFKTIPFVNIGGLKNSRSLPPTTNKNKNCGRADSLNILKISSLTKFWCAESEYLIKKL